MSTTQSDTIKKNEERLVNNRKKVRRRNEQKRILRETKMRDVKELLSLNDSLKKENQSLIRELRKYGIVMAEGTVYAAENQSNPLSIPCFRDLPDTRQQQSCLNQSNRIIKTGVGIKTYSQPSHNAMAQPAFQHIEMISNRLKRQKQEKPANFHQPSLNTIAPMLRPTSLYGGIPSHTNYLKQVMGDNLDQQLWQVLHERTVEASITFQPRQNPPSLTSTPIVHNINQHIPTVIPIIQNATIRGHTSSFSLENMPENSLEGQQQPLLNSHSAGETYML